MYRCLPVKLQLHFLSYINYDDNHSTLHSFHNLNIKATHAFRRLFINVFAYKINQQKVIRILLLLLNQTYRALYSQINVL